MGTSKAPETTRNVPVLTSAEDGNEDEKEEIRMPAPPVDWAFNDLLVNIANEMTEEDLEDAKARFKGDEGFGRRLLSEIKTPLQLFDSLQKHLFLSRNNLLFLQAMLFKIGRMDLYDMALDYAQTIGDVIYFCSPPLEPANGYRYIQFHIEGKDFSKVKRSSLEAMRMTAARLMIVPPEYVIIAGIEPSSSLLITFMIPERFIKFLEAALNQEPAIKELTYLGIDIVRIGDKVVNIHGIEGVDIIETEEQTKLRTIYDQLQITKEKLEDRDIECLQLKKKLEKEDSRKHNIDNQMQAVLIKMMFESYSNQKIPSLSKQSAFVFFKHVLNLVRQRNYDKDIIALLLDAQAALLSTRVRDSQEIQLKALRFENRRLRDSLFQFQIANTRLQILSAIDSPEFQRKFVESLKSLMEGQRIEVSRVVGFNPVIFLILKEISGMLRDEDRKTLLSAYTWPETDDLTKQLKTDENDLLAVLVAKETSRKGGQFPLEEFIRRKLADIKREDLKILFNEMVATYMSKTDYMYVPPATGGSAQQQATFSRQQSKPSKHQNKSGKPQFGRKKTVIFRPRQHQPKPTGQPPEAKPTQEEQIAELLKKVTNMEGMMQAAQTAYKSSTFGSDIFQPNLFSQFKRDPSNLFGRYAPTDIPSPDR